MSIKWWGDKREWGIICGTKEAEITSVRILDGCGRKTTKVAVGDKIIVKAEFDVHEEVKEPHFGVAIFRDDGIYCYGPNSLFDRHRIEKLMKGKGWFSIEYKKMLLMPGKYWFSVGVWDKEEMLPYSFHIAYYSFRITGTNKNKQLLFLTHKWNDDKLVDSFTAKELIPIDLNFLEEEWQQKFSIKNSNVDIDPIQLLDSRGNIKDSFNTNEMMKIRIKIGRRNWHNYLIWIGISRIDGIYCHGALRNLAKDEKTLSLIYPKLQLLPGNYYLSVGIW